MSTYKILNPEGNLHNRIDLLSRIEALWTTIFRDKNK